MRRMCKNYRKNIGNMNAFFAVSQPILNCFIARLIARPIENSFLSAKIIHRLLVKHLLAPVFSADRLPVLGGPARRLFRLRKQLCRLTHSAAKAASRSCTLHCCMEAARE